MGLTVSTIAPTFRLTTRARVQAELGISSDGPLIDSLIDAASAAIVRYCHRPFAREAVTEVLAGFGGIHLQLKRTPIVGSPSSISYDTTVLTDVTVEDADQGLLYRRDGFGWTVQAYAGLSGGGRFFDFGTPLARQEEPLYSVSYVAGYILPPQNVLNQNTLSVDSADDSFNDSSAGFPALLKAGDIVTSSGFDNAANNGRFVVTGTPTTSKVPVSAALTAEVAGRSASIVFQSLPEDVEKAAIEAAKAFMASRQTDSNVVEKQVGPMRVRLSEAAAGLPPLCVGLLQPWVRAA
jgi:hypothetical protein